MKFYPEDIENARKLVREIRAGCDVMLDILSKDGWHLGRMQLVVENLLSVGMDLNEAMSLVVHSIEEEDETYAPKEYPLVPEDVQEGGNK